MQLFNVTIPMAAPGTLVLNFGAKQSYSSTSGSNPWNVYFYVDGNFVTTTGGSRAATDSVSLVGAYKDLPAGDHSVVVEWNANSNINISNMTLVVQASYK